MEHGKPASLHADVRLSRNASNPSPIGLFRMMSEFLSVGIPPERRSVYGYFKRRKYKATRGNKNATEDVLTGVVYRNEKIVGHPSRR